MLKTMQEKAYHEIKNAIIHRQFEPGACISEREMSERLGIGRTPVRDAMKQLSYEGWFYTMPGSGMVVADYDYKDMEESFLVRGQLDALAVTMCANAVTPEMLLSLEYPLNACELALNRKDYLANTQHDADFHIRCVEASGNKYLANIYQIIMGHVPKSNYLQVENEPFAWRSLEEHRSIFAAIREGDAVLAERYTREHIERIIRGIREKASESSADTEK